MSDKSNKSKKTIGSGRGGKRPGAGRKKGVPAKKVPKVGIDPRSTAKKLSSTKAIELAHKDGESPLEYLLRTMRRTDDDLIEMENQGLIDTALRLKMQAERDKRRDNAAEKAAPYVHPRLAAIEHKGDPDNPIKQEWIIRVVDATGNPAEVEKK